MGSGDITKEQADQMRRSLFRLTHYLRWLTSRMERRGFPTHDPLYQHAKKAYDAVCSLYMELHYMSCDGVAREKHEK
jgi:hypothetical protein